MVRLGLRGRDVRQQLQAVLDVHVALVYVRRKGHDVGRNQVRWVRIERVASREGAVDGQHGVDQVRAQVDRALDAFQKRLFVLRKPIVHVT